GRPRRDRSGAKGACAQAPLMPGMPDDSWLPKAFLEKCPACLWIAGPQVVIQEVYGDPSSVFGKSQAELKGQTISKAWTSRFGRAFAGETLMLRERHGDSTWYITLFPIRLEGQIAFAGGLAREITPWSTAEQELRQTVLGA